MRSTCCARSTPAASGSATAPTTSGARSSGCRPARSTTSASPTSRSPRYDDRVVLHDDGRVDVVGDATAPRRVRRPRAIAPASSRARPVHLQPRPGRPRSGVRAHPRAARGGRVLPGEPDAPACRAPSAPDPLDLYDALTRAQPRAVRERLRRSTTSTSRSCRRLPSCSSASRRDARRSPARRDATDQGHRRRRRQRWRAARRTGPRT